MPDRFHGIEVDMAKLRDYCLSETHLRGRHKARVFRARLGLTVRDANSSAENCWMPPRVSKVR